MKEKIDNLDFITIENFCSMKDSVRRMKAQLTDREKLFAKHISDKGPVSKIYKEFLILAIRKQTNQLINGQKI